jgi:hypothetical protein
MVMHATHEPTYYEVVGVREDASDGEVVKACRVAAFTHHPDRGGDVVTFRLTTEAREHLCDPLTRAEYDRLLTARRNWQRERDEARADAMHTINPDDAPSNGEVEPFTPLWFATSSQRPALPEGPPRLRWSAKTRMVGAALPFAAWTLRSLLYKPFLDVAGADTVSPPGVFWLVIAVTLAVLAPYAAALAPTTRLWVTVGIIASLAAVEHAGVILPAFLALGALHTAASRSSQPRRLGPN